MLKEIYKSVYRRYLLKDSHFFFKNLLIDRKMKCGYVQIPKAACSTIKFNIISHFHEGKVNESTTQQVLHDNAKHWIVYGSDDFSDCFFKKNKVKILIFTFIRNPYTRILSAFREKIELQLDSDKYRLDLGLPVDRKVSFEEFLDALSDREVCEYDVHFMPQSCIVSDMFTDKIFIGSIENINEDLMNLLRVLKSNKVRALTSRLEHKTASSNQDVIYKYFSNKDIVSKFRDIYRNDFDVFGYSDELENVHLPPKSNRIHKKCTDICLSDKGMDISLRIDMYIKKTYQRCIDLIK